MHSILWGAHDWPEGSVISVCKTDPTTGFRTVGFVSPADADSAFTLIERASRTALATYMGVGVLSARPSSGRGKSADVMGVPALFVDIDTADGFHKPSSCGRPHPTREQAAELLASAPWGAPSLLVDTSGGFHPYYALREPLDPHTDEGRAILTQWDAWWTAAAHERGFAIDTGLARDAARVLRPAGTRNRKGGEDRPVVIETAEPSVRYHAEDIARYFPDDNWADDVVAEILGDAPAAQQVIIAPRTSEADGTSPLTRLDRQEGALAALLEHLGLRERRTQPGRWTFPNDGEYSRDDSHGVVRMTAESKGSAVEVARLWAATGSRLEGAWGMSGHQWGAASVLVNRVCGGDASLAARVVARHDADIDAILDAIHNLDPDGLAAEYPVPTPRAMTVATAREVTTSTGAISTTTLPDATVASEAARFALTELGIAERWNAYWGAYWRWTWEGESAGSWRHWNGKLWVAATEGDLTQTIVATVRQGMQHHELAHIEPVPGDEPLSDRMDEARRKRIGAAMSFETAGRLKAIASLLRSLSGVSVSPDAWDADDDVMNARDGIVDLRTGELRPHDPSAMCTRIAAGSGRSDIAVSTDLQTVLDGYALTDPALPEWFQTMAGVACTGRSPRLFSHIFGVPKAGKSSIIGALERALGGGASGALKSGTGYATRVEIDALQPTSSPGAPREALQPIEGARLVLVDEASHAIIDANTVKLIASGEMISARANYGSSRTWRSHATLLLFGNDELRLPSTDAGLVDRFYPVKFTTRVEVLDENLIDRLRTPEAADAVLAWAIRGAVAWYARGGGQAALAAPDCVLAGRRKYVVDANPLSTWLDEAVTVIPEDEQDGPLAGVAMVSELREAYSRWARDSGQKPVSAKAFPDYLRAAGHAPDDARTTSRAGEPVPRSGTFVRSLAKLTVPSYPGGF